MSSERQKIAQLDRVLTVDEENARLRTRVAQLLDIAEEQRVRANKAAHEVSTLRRLLVIQRELYEAKLSGEV